MAFYAIPLPLISDPLCLGPAELPTESGLVPAPAADPRRFTILPILGMEDADCGAHEARLRTKSPEAVMTKLRGKDIRVTNEKDKVAQRPRTQTCSNAFPPLPS